MPDKVLYELNSDMAAAAKIEYKVLAECGHL